MKSRRLDRINSLLREVIYEVIRGDVKNPHVNLFVSVTKVDTSADLHHAKVYVSLIGTQAEKEKVLHALESAAGFIAVHASKKVDIRHFPELTFRIDTSADEHSKIEEILSSLREEREKRGASPENDPS